MQKSGFKNITYKTNHPDVPGNCWFKIYKLNGNTVVVLSEDDSTKGSITNFVEEIATTIQKKYLSDVEPKKVIWFEHWGPTRSIAKPRATLKHVKLDWNKEYFKPEWTEYRKGNLAQSSDPTAHFASILLNDLPMGSY